MKLKCLFSLALFSGTLFAQSAPLRVQSLISTPAVSTKATVSVPAADNVRHVADGVCFSGGSTTAPALTLLTVNLIDGASGGTAINSWTVVVPAAVGQNVAPFCVMGLEQAGTNATAMTLEFSALLTNLFESVTLLYHNTVQ
jgi:hypothetical protein